MASCANPFFHLNAARPCGDCEPCRIARACSWRDRIELETHHQRAVHGRASSFVTLTYDPEHLPTTAPGFGTFASGVLIKAEADQFLKNLRQRVARAGGHEIRFYCAGEYGEKSWRAHWHLTLHGYGPGDVIGRHTFAEHVQLAWGRGNTKTLPLKLGAASYVSSYMTKNHRKAGHPALGGRPPEFSFASAGRRKGVGGLGTGAVDHHAATLALGRYASSVDRTETSEVIKTDLRDIPILGRALKRLRTKLGFADPADAIQVRERYLVRAINPPSIRNSLDQPVSCPVFDTMRRLDPQLFRHRWFNRTVQLTILQRVGREYMHEASAKVAGMLDAKLQWGSEPNQAVTARDAYGELYGYRVAKLVAQNAAYLAQRELASVH